MGIANSHGNRLFGWCMVVFRYGRKSISSICIGLFILRDFRNADFHVHKESSTEVSNLMKNP